MDIGKILGKLPWMSKIPLQGNGMAAIPKTLAKERNGENCIQEIDPGWTAMDCIFFVTKFCRRNLAMVAEWFRPSVKELILAGTQVQIPRFKSLDKLKLFKSLRS